MSINQELWGRVSFSEGGEEQAALDARIRKSRKRLPTLSIALFLTWVPYEFHPGLRMTSQREP